MFDFHRHITNSKTIDNALYNTTSIKEWDYNTKHFSIGLLANNINKDNDYYINKMEKLLIKNPKFHIGEIGLDNRFNNIDIQVDLFVKTLKLAIEYNRLFTIHIVKNNNLLLNILNENKKYLPNHIIYHGFNKSLDLAKQLKYYNTIISINPKSLNTKLMYDIKALDKLGFLVESDWDKKNDEGYDKYFSSFINILEEKKATKFKDVNNEFRSILENF